MLIKCPECGKDISTEANACPFCGFPLKKHLAKGRQKGEVKRALWKDIVGIASSSVGLFVLCPFLLSFGMVNNSDVMIIFGAAIFVLLLFPFIVSAINLSKRNL